MPSLFFCAVWHRRTSLSSSHKRCRGWRKCSFFFYTYTPQPPPPPPRPSPPAFSSFFPPPTSALPAEADGCAAVATTPASDSGYKSGGVWQLGAAAEPGPCNRRGEATNLHHPSTPPPSSPWCLHNKWGGGWWRGGGEGM